MNSIKNNFPEMMTDEAYENFKQNNNKLFNKIAQEIRTKHQLRDAPLTLLEGTNLVFSHENSRIIKIFPPFHKKQFDHEVLTMQHLHNKLSVKTPKIEHLGEIEQWPYIIMSQLEGTLLEGLWETLDHQNKIIIIRELGSLIREVHSLPTKGLEAIDCHWKTFIDKQLKQCVARHQETGLPDILIHEIPSYLNSMKEIVSEIQRSVILTGEYTPMNFLVKQEKGTWHIHGLIDFGDSMLGLSDYDLLGPGAFLIQGDKVLLREFLSAYGYTEEQMTSTLSRKLTALMLLHRYSNLKIQIRIKHWQNKVKRLEDLEELVWGF